MINDQLKKKVEDVLLAFLAIKAYPEIPDDLSVMENAIHPKVLIDEIYGVDDIESIYDNPNCTAEDISRRLDRSLARWNLQDKYIKQAINRNPVKLQLVIRQLFFADLFIYANRDRDVVNTELKFEAVKLARSITEDEHQYIKWVARLAKHICKTHREKLAFYREHLSGMEKYSSLINAYFKNDRN
jgi:hypothetical protein